MPKSQVPEWVKKQWIGVEIPYITLVTSYKVTLGFADARPEQPYVAFLVSQDIAINALRAKTGTEEAVRWWNDAGFPQFGGMFTFNKECAEVVAPSPA